MPLVCAGLTDDIRSNFTVMKDLANEMKLDPGKRVVNLQEFMRNMNKCVCCWPLSLSVLSPSLVTDVDALSSQERSSPEGDAAVGPEVL